jgi:hypothetical protein
MKQALKQYLKLQQRLQWQSQRYNLPFTVDTKLIEFSEAHKQVETDRYGNKQTYSYPSTLEVKIENKSNHFYSLRTKDCRWIREGCVLSGEGWTLPQVYRCMLKEMRRVAKQQQTKAGA